MRINRVGAELGCFAQVREGLSCPLLDHEEAAEEKVGRKIVRVQTQRALELFRCLGIARSSLIYQS